MARDKKIEDDFIVIEDAGDEALFSFYNDGHKSPERVPFAENIKQKLTNFGFNIGVNGSQKVDLADTSSR